MKFDLKSRWNSLQAKGTIKERDARQKVARKRAVDRARSARVSLSRIAASSSKTGLSTLWGGCARVDFRSLTVGFGPLKIDRHRFNA